MCGRYGFVPTDNFGTRFGAGAVKMWLEPRYNVAPGALMPIITRNGTKTVEQMKWGLVPFWAKDPRIGYRTINARAETVASKPTFRRPFKAQRCLVPATGFFEWTQTPDGKQPYYITLKSHPMFAFAGLYDTWKDAEGKPIKSYTIITTKANTLMAKIHERMPVILPQEKEDAWLNAKLQDIKTLQSFLKPYNSSNMKLYPVTRQMNKPEFDRPEAIKPQGEVE